jgi:hypothetical protein
VELKSKVTFLITKLVSRININCGGDEFPLNGFCGEAIFTPTSQFAHSKRVSNFKVIKFIAAGIEIHDAKQQTSRPTFFFPLLDCFSFVFNFKAREKLKLKVTEKSRQTKNKRNKFS